MALGRKQARRDRLRYPAEWAAWLEELDRFVGAARPAGESMTLISSKEAAALLGCGTRTVTKLCEMGKLRTAERLEGERAWWIDEASVRERLEFRKAA